MILSRLITTVTLLLTLAFSEHAMAQSIVILLPDETVNVPSGGSFVAQLQQTTGTSSLSQVSLVMAVAACENGVCPSNDPATFSNAGQVLFNGNFDPEFDPFEPDLGDFQEFDLTLPAGWPAGESVLLVGHVFNVGSSGEQVFEFQQAHFSVFTPESQSG